MFPTWMNEMLQCLTCSACRTRLTADDIEVVGVRRPQEWEAWSAEPIFVISLVCRNCEQQTNALHRQPLAEVTNAITAFVKVIEQQCNGKQPPMAIPGKTKPATPPGNVTGAKTANVPLPSRRRNQPVAPPTQAEIKAFLNRLRKTSFKRGSKGFKAWMKDLGADRDQNIDDSAT